MGNRLRYQLKVNEFLKESNAIEGVYGEESLVDAHKAWNYILSQSILNKNVILKVHTILMERHLSGRNLGKFRKCRVFIAGREGIPYSLISNRMMNWCRQMNNTRAWEEIKTLHIEYEKIHPFVDGNGRTGRIFMNWVRKKNNLGILVIEEAKRFEYYKWFD